MATLGDGMELRHELMMKAEARPQKPKVADGRGSSCSVNPCSETTQIQSWSRGRRVSAISHCAVKEATASGLLNSLEQGSKQREMMAANGQMIRSCKEHQTSRLPRAPCA